jgi:hypothetical protein
MVEATSTLSGLGFSPLDYVAMWSNAARAAQTPTSAAGNGGRPVASSVSGASANATSQLSSSVRDTGTTRLFSAGEDVSLQVELDIARLKAAAQQALRNRATQMAAGGAYVSGGATYAYSIGPDGQLYATGVTLSYDTTPIADDPQGTILKMQRIRAAALASSTPTAADYAAVAAATEAELQARLEIVRRMAEQYLDSGSAVAVEQTGTLLDAQA